MTLATPETKRNASLVDNWQTESIAGGTKSSVPSRQQEG